jgi:hypothetical protein
MIWFLEQELTAVVDPDTVRSLGRESVVELVDDELHGFVPRGVDELAGSHRSTSAVASRWEKFFDDMHRCQLEGCRAQAEDRGRNNGRQPGTGSSAREPFLGLMLTLDVRSILQMASEIDAPRPRRDDAQRRDFLTSSAFIGVGGARGRRSLEASRTVGRNSESEDEIQPGRARKRGMKVNAVNTTRGSPGSLDV